MSYGRASRVLGVVLCVEFEYFIEIFAARTYSLLDEQDEQPYDDMNGTITNLPKFLVLGVFLGVESISDIHNITARLIYIVSGTRSKNLNLNRNLRSFFDW